MPTPAPSLVLVHGAWGGGWVWRRVLGPLRDAGFDLSDTRVFRHRKLPGLMAELLQGSARRAD